MSPPIMEVKDQLKGPAVGRIIGLPVVVALDRLVDLHPGAIVLLLDAPPIGSRQPTNGQRGVAQTAREGEARGGGARGRLELQGMGAHQGAYERRDLQLVLGGQEQRHIGALKTRGGELSEVIALPVIGVFVGWRDQILDRRLDDAPRGDDHARRVMGDAELEGHLGPASVGCAPDVDVRGRDHRVAQCGLVVSDHKDQIGEVLGEVTAHVLAVIEHHPGRIALQLDSTVVDRGVAGRPVIGDLVVDHHARGVPEGVARKAVVSVVVRGHLKERQTVVADVLMERVFQVVIGANQVIGSTELGRDAGRDLVVTGDASIDDVREIRACIIVVAPKPAEHVVRTIGVGFVGVDEEGGPADVSRPAPLLLGLHQERADVIDHGAAQSHIGVVGDRLAKRPKGGLVPLLVFPPADQRELGVLSGVRLAPLGVGEGVLEFMAPGAHLQRAVEVVPGRPVMPVLGDLNRRANGLAVRVTKERKASCDVVGGVAARVERDGHRDGLLVLIMNDEAMAVVPVVLGRVAPVRTPASADLTEVMKCDEEDPSNRIPGGVLQGLAARAVELQLGVLDLHGLRRVQPHVSLGIPACVAGHGDEGEAHLLTRSRSLIGRLKEEGSIRALGDDRRGPGELGQDERPALPGPIDHLHRAVPVEPGGLRVVGYRVAGELHAQGHGTAARGALGAMGDDEVTGHGGEFHRARQFPAALIGHLGNVEVLHEVTHVAQP